MVIHPHTLPLPLALPQWCISPTRRPARKSTSLFPLTIVFALSMNLYCPRHHRRPWSPMCSIIISHIRAWAASCIVYHSRRITVSVAQRLQWQLPRRPQRLFLRALPRRCPPRPLRLWLCCCRRRHRCSIHSSSSISSSRWAAWLACVRCSSSWCI